MRTTTASCRSRSPAARPASSSGRRWRRRTPGLNIAAVATAGTPPDLRGLRLPGQPVRARTCCSGRSPSDGQRRQPVDSSRRPTQLTTAWPDPNVFHRQGDAHLRQRHHGRRRPVHGDQRRRQPGVPRPRCTRPPTCTSRATTRASAFFDPGPPRQVGGVNAAAGELGAPRRGHAGVGALPGGRLQRRLRRDRRQRQPDGAEPLNDTIEPRWSTTASACSGTSAQRARQRAPARPSPGRPGASATSRRSQLGLAASTQTTGQTATVTVAARNGDGNPDPGRAVRYAIAGANPGAGAVTTGADGTAAITWTGVTRGHRHPDRLHRHQRQRRARRRRAPAGRDGHVDPGAAAAPPPPPVPGKSVVVKVVSGQVFIKLPGSGRAAGRPGRRRGSCRSRARRTSRSARSWTRARAAWR